MFEPVGLHATLQPTRVQSWLAIGAIWSVVAAAATRTWKAHDYADRWRRAVAGTVSVADARRGHDVIVTLDRIGWVCVGASAVALVLWTHGVARNAIARGVRGVDLQRARWSWLIPLLGIGRSIAQLRQAVKGVGYSDHRLGRWLWVAYIHFYVVFFTQLAMAHSWVTATTVRAKLDSLDTQTQIMFAVTLWVVASAVIATLAIRHTDRAVSKI